MRWVVYSSMPILHVVSVFQGRWVLPALKQLQQIIKNIAKTTILHVVSVFQGRWVLPALKQLQKIIKNIAKTTILHVVSVFQGRWVLPALKQLQQIIKNIAKTSSYKAEKVRHRFSNSIYRVTSVVLFVLCFTRMKKLYFTSVCHVESTGDSNPGSRGRQSDILQCRNVLLLDVIVIPDEIDPRMTNNMSLNPSVTSHDRASIRSPLRVFCKNSTRTATSSSRSQLVSSNSTRWQCQGSRTASSPPTPWSIVATRTMT